LLELVLAGLVATAVGVFVARSHSADDQSARALMAIELPDAHGRLQRIDQWRGKVVVVNFWATWCAPCREEMPEFVKAQAADGGRGLQFVGIAVDQADKVRQYAAQIGLNYPTLIGGLGAMELSKSLGNRLVALPFTVVLDRQGHVVHTQLGEFKRAKLDAVIAPLLAAPAAS
jgi:thiol-disulfide isomerase/thioredoxin